jgi:MoaA/NifB/PqqE/SkfB family radical SAM enzyme
VAGEQLGLGTEALLSNFRRPLFPFKLTFAVTYNCNSRCSTCNIWKKKSRDELTLAEIDSFLKKNGGFRWVGITGGEPFLRKDLPEICASFLRNCPLYTLTITTNSLLPKIQIAGIKKIAALGIPRLVVTLSCDGPPEVHDRIRGVPGNFEKVCAVYSALRGLQSKNFEIFFGMTLSPGNVGTFDSLLLELKKRFPEVTAKKLHVNLFHSSSHFYGNKKGSTSWIKDAKTEIANVLSKRKFSPIDPIGFLEKRYLEKAGGYLENGKSPLPCVALSSSIFLDPHGNIYPCTIWDKKMANIRETPEIGKIWNSPEFRKTALAARTLSCPNCWTPCEAYQTIAANFLR